MSAPILSHIAALVRAYFPKLTVTEIKSILLQSCWKPNDPSIKLDEISAEGGIINAALCIQNAIQFQSNNHNK
jgi:hypothetical protein